MGQWAELGYNLSASSGRVSEKDRSFSVHPSAAVAVQGHMTDRGNESMKTDLIQLIRDKRQLAAGSKPRPLTCHKPPVVPPPPQGDVSCWGAADTRQGETPGRRRRRGRQQTRPHLKSVSCSVDPTTKGTSLCSICCSQTAKGGASSTYPSTATMGPTKRPLSGRSVRSAAAQNGYWSQGTAWPRRRR